MSHVESGNTIKSILVSRSWYLQLHLASLFLSFSYTIRGRYSDYNRRTAFARLTLRGLDGSCSGGPAYDHRLDNMSTCAPFASLAKFNDFLVAPVKNCPRPELVAKYRNMLSDESYILFAHADISRENILVDPETGSVTGTAGF